MKRDWKRSIIFEGVELPGSAIAIDHLGMYGNLPGISEAASEWLWRLTICVGCPKTENSEVITLHASEALRLAEHFRNRLIQTVPEKFTEPFESQIIDEWINALRIIIEVASTRHQCTWESPLRPDDPNYGRPLVEVHSEMVAKMEKCFERANKKPWWKKLLSTGK